jgi:tetratricopeptide (TPR) repeat protein
MAQLGLKEYVAKLDQLLSVESADEAIQHSRHILKYFPKNIAVWRILGRGLVQAGRWQEAESAFRRVLTVLPDDYSAHLGLSEAYTSLNRGSEAISHLERAYEQNPNSRELIDGLRGLYRRFRRAERVKMQLTAAAIARQHRRNGVPAQALDVLRAALAHTPDRIDLRLLLAETLWEQGAHHDAAEIALSVLKILPDCLTANRIMARLWLDEKRPSDAMRFINRLEALDPYLAYTLVQGTPPPDDAFRLDEIDYQRFAQGELVSRRPDWLQSIGASAPAMETRGDEEQPAWLSAALSNLPDEQPARRPSSAVEEDWMANVPRERASTPRLTDALDLPQEFSSDARDVNTGELDALFGESRRGLTGALNLPREFSSDARDVNTNELDALFGDDADETLPGWMLQAPYASSDRAASAAAESDESPDLDALFGSLEGTPKASTMGDDFNFSFEDSAAKASADDSFSFDFDDDAAAGATIKDDFSLDFAAQDDEPAFAASPSDADTPAWLLSDDEADAEPAFAALPSDTDTPAWLLNDDEQDDEPALGVLGSAPATTTEDDLPDWMQSAMTDDSATFATTPATPAAESMDWLSDDLFNEAPAANDSTDDDPDPLGWLMGGEADDPRPFDSTAAQMGAPAREWTAEMDMNDDQKRPDASSNDVPDWLSSSGGAPSPSSADDDLSDTGALMAEADANSDDLSWLSEARAAAKDAGVEEDDLAWLNAADDADDEPIAAANDISWLTSDDPLTLDDPLNASNAPISAGDELAWLTADDPLMRDEPLTADDAPMMDDESPVLTEELPDWLTQMQPEGASLNEMAAATAPDEDDDDGMSWLSEVEADSESSQAVTLNAPPDELSWLSDVRTGAQLGSEVTVTASSDELAWLADVQGETAADAVGAAPSDDLAWLSGESAIQPASDMPDWMSELQPAEAAADSPPIGMPTTGDLAWLADDQDAGAPIGMPTTGDLAWLADDQDAGAPIGMPTTGDLAWLADDQDAGAPIGMPTTGDLTWLADDQDDAHAVPADADDLAWLTSEADKVSAPALPSTEELAWMGEDSPADDDQPALAVSDMPDWLTEVAPEAVAADSKDDHAPVPDEADEFGWLTEKEDDAPALASTPEWLSTLEQLTEPSSEETMLSAKPTLPATDDLPAVASVNDTPDWLTAIDPTLSDKSSEPEADMITTTSDDFAWYEDEDKPQSVASVDEVPDWLSAIQEGDEAAAESDALAPVGLADGEGDMAMDSDTDLETIMGDILAKEDTLSADAPLADPETLIMSEMGESDDEAVADDLDAIFMSDAPSDDEATADDFDALVMREIAAQDELDAPPEGFDTLILDANAAVIPPSADAMIDGITDETEMAIPQLALDDGFADEVALVPAENAPDWLNAMVPGLDVDYEAREDEIAEVAALEERAAPSLKRDYDWVVGLAAAESALETPPPARPRFVFSRLPAWMSGDKPAPASSDGLPDWVDDEGTSGSADVPAWLK